MPDGSDYIPQPPAPTVSGAPVMIAYLSDGRIKVWFPEWVEPLRVLRKIVHDLRMTREHIPEKPLTH